MSEDRADRPAALLIAGPTTSGKSALALRLAVRQRGLVINADSMQVYRDLRIITARPSEADEREAPHALFGHVDAAETYSVSRWLADARSALDRARREDLLPILVGGTGLYFKALSEGLSEIPNVPREVRAEIRVWAAARTPEVMHAELARRDPATAARLRPSDPQRIVRALEVYAATGAGLTAFQAARAPALLDISLCRAVYLTTERGVLRTRIDQRFDQMMEAGALDEVRGLARRGLDPNLPATRALGVPALLGHLRGETDLATAVAEAKAQTGRYVRRQDTFARHQLPVFRPVVADEAEAWLEATPQSV